MNRESDFRPAILLVDDLPANLVSLEALLDDGQTELIAVGSGEAALEVLLEQKIALVLLDVQMPGMDGYEVARLMRKNSRTRDVPILMITAHSRADSEIIKGLEAGAIDYLIKPIDTKALRAKITNLLASRGSHLQLERIHESSEQTRAFYSAILETTGEGILVVDQDEFVQYSNPAAERLLRNTGQSFVGIELKTVLPFDRRTATSGQVGLRLEQITREHGKTATEIIMRAMDEGALPVQMSCAALPAPYSGWVLAFQNITHIKELEQSLRTQAATDPLTRLYNREGFFNACNMSIEVALDAGRKLALLYLDIDEFKLINDTQGHPVGDRLLCEFCQRLKDQLRVYDVLARLGGDEFAILLTNIADVDQVIAVADKILKAQEQSYAVFDLRLSVGVSIGIALYPDCGQSTEGLLQAADTAMYQAKRSGRNQFQFYSEEMNSMVLSRALLLDSLFEAIAERQFFLEYQPQVRISDGALIGFEALIRWQHPTAGLVAPATFIPLLEESNLIFRITDWVLNEACQQMAVWAPLLNTDIKMAINLSAKQFRDTKLVATIESLLVQYGLAAVCLELEVTEGALIQDIQASCATMEALRKLGIAISLDDFGTGYSSLAYLKQFQLDVLKIDRLFVANLEHEARDRAIAQAIIRLAHELDMKVVAEGVETLAQLEMLASMGCEAAQGYYLSRPVRAAGMAALLQMRDLRPGR